MLHEKFALPTPVESDFSYKYQPHTGIIARMIQTLNVAASEDSVAEVETMKRLIEDINEQGKVCTDYQILEPLIDIATRRREQIPSLQDAVFALAYSAGAEKVAGILLNGTDQDRESRIPIDNTPAAIAA